MRATPDGWKMKLQFTGVPDRRGAKALLIFLSGEVSIMIYRRRQEEEEEYWKRGRNWKGRGRWNRKGRTRKRQAKRIPR